MEQLKESSVCFDESQIFMKELNKTERSRILDLAVKRLLSWDSYTTAPWEQAALGICSIGPGSTWLDVVEMGVEYRKRSVLLKPVNFAIPISTFKMLELAERRVIKIRPNLDRKGVIAGIIRSAIAHDVLLNQLGAELEENIEVGAEEHESE